MIYPGTCRQADAKQMPYASRIKVNDIPITFNDAIQGSIAQHLATQVGDFVLKRADGLFAYQLAVVVDDFQQGVTDIVRGADLLDSTPRQIYIQQQLDIPTPHYAHIPVASNAAGEKLSKQTLAPAIEAKDASAWLIKSLAFLGQNPPSELITNTPSEILSWAKQHWQLKKIPKQRSIIFE